MRMRSVKNKPMSALLNYGGKQKKGRQRCRKNKVWSGSLSFDMGIAKDFSKYWYWVMLMVFQSIGFGIGYS